MDNENVELYIIRSFKKKEILSFVKTQVESESIMLNKISQADNDKTAYHLYVNMKKMNLLTV